MRYLFLILPILSWSEESFISYYEYGEMLYNNPRGISCALCHGASGEGKVIVRYKVNSIEGNDIRNATLPTMIKSMKATHKIMPRYYITDVEVKAIYDFLKVKNKEDIIK